MNYLEARELLRNFRRERRESYRLIMSGTPNELIMFLRAQAARRSVDVSIETIPFGTLQQYILEPPSDDKPELFMLTPWDFCPQGDWRSGVPSAPTDLDSLRRDSNIIAERLAKRSHAVFGFLAAPCLPILPNDRDNALLSSELRILAEGLDALILDEVLFSLSAYLMTGTFTSGTHLGILSKALDGLFNRKPAGLGKVLVTDLDNVLWSGLAAEDGRDRVRADPGGKGYPHYLYQSYLKRLKNDGILLAAVSRNSSDDVIATLSSESMLLQPDDFIAIAATYGAKSSQIKAIVKELNLGMESVVFIDDNPVELAEVSTAIPDATCIAFPISEAGVPELFSSMARCFRRQASTAEDGQRTEMYRHRFATLPPSNEEGADTSAFLADLSMTLEINHRLNGSWDRAVQLINKTNQFNLNGKQFDDRGIRTVISSGGKLLTVTLADRMGTHGEISAILISADGMVLAWVLSCRAFQRCVEHALLAWLFNPLTSELSFDFCKTEKNLPLQNFISDPAFSQDHGGRLVCNLAAFSLAHTDALNLFQISEKF